MSSEHLQPRPRGNCSGRVRQLLAAWLHDWDRLYKPRPLFVWEGYLLEQGIYLPLLVFSSLRFLLASGGFCGAMFSCRLCLLHWPYWVWTRRLAHHASVYLAPGEPFAQTVRVCFPSMLFHVGTGGSMSLPNCAVQMVSIVPFGFVLFFACRRV